MYCRNCGNKFDKEILYEDNESDYKQKYSLNQRLEEIYPIENELDKLCNKCGCRVSNGINYCQNCGAKTSPRQEVCIECGESLTIYNPEVDKINHMDMYYRNEFTKVYNNPEYKGKFNWAAFLFGFLWLISKNMFFQSLVFVMIAIIIFNIFPILFFIPCLILGFRGNYLYYNYYINHKNKMF